MKAITINREIGHDVFLFLALYTVLWLILSGGEGWTFGALFIALATFLSIRLGFSLRIFRPLHLPRFFIYYLQQLLVAGWQVAYTACRPRMSVEPAWVSLKLRSRSDPTRLMVAAFVCLLPGTLTARVEEGIMHIHLLDKTRPWRATVEELETRLMTLLGETTQ